MTHDIKQRITNPVLVILGILLIASSLRSPITDIGPILNFITHDFNLSATQAGMLTTLPLVAFAIFSPLSSRLSRKVGLERSLMIALILITVGIVIRSTNSSETLFIGTCVLGVGIAIGNVLLPSILKRDFPNHVPTLTAIYVLVMGVSSTISASFAIPMVHMANTLHITMIPHWAFSLATVIVFPAIAIVLWLPQIKKQNKTSINAVTLQSENHGYIWKSIAAWQVSLFLGLNSFVMYIFVSWLPSILISDGYSAHEAGYLQGILQFSTAVPALVLIPLMAKVKDKRSMSIFLVGLTLIGVLGLLLIPQYALFSVIMLGLGCGGGFILGLSFVGLRTHTPLQAAALSGMAQSMGYLFAATGPIVIGSLHEMTGNWHLPLTVAAVSCFLSCIIAFYAGRSDLIAIPNQ